MKASPQQVASDAEEVLDESPERSVDGGSVDVRNLDAAVAKGKAARLRFEATEQVPTVLGPASKVEVVDEKRPGSGVNGKRV